MRMSERPVDREFKSHQPHVFVMVIFASGACREGLGRNYYRAGQDSVTEAMAPAAPEGSPPAAGKRLRIVFKKDPPPTTSNPWGILAEKPPCPAVIREGS